MSKKVITSASDAIIFKLKVLAKEKEDIRRKLEITATKLKDKAEALIVTAKEKEKVRKKLEITAGELRESRKTLEQKVFERTRDLADVVADLKKFKLAVEDVYDHIIISDSEGVVLYANPAAEKITGFKREEIVGKKAGALWGGLMDKTFYEKMWKTIKIEKKTFLGNIINKRKTGEQYESEIHISPILDKDSNPIFFVAIERDITKEKAIDKAKTEFVSLVSHQFRTPLTSINWYIEILQGGDEGELNDKQKEFLSEIYKSSKRMVQLVNDLLNVSRLETARLKIEPVPTDLIAFLNGVRKELEPQIHNAGCQVLLDFPEKKIATVNVDQELLRQVIVNLLINAINYSSAAKKGNVIVSLSVSAKEYTISVKDDGIGVPKDVQSRIFEKFFRGDNAREVVVEGNGLGLYLSKQIMEVSGGTIGFSSEVGQGTKFYVTIPLAGMKPKQGEIGLKR